MKKLIALAFLLSLPIPAHAIQCGDTLANGDYTLTADVGPCPGVGPVLTVSAAKLNMNGFAVRCENVYLFDGTNLVFSQGIALTANNSSLSNGSVIGCGNGVIVGGGGRHTVSYVTAGGGWIGFLVQSCRNNVRYSTGSGPFAGFIISGNRNDVHHNVAHSASYGFSVSGEENTVNQNNATTNVGFYASGISNALTNNIASGLGNLSGITVDRATNAEIRGNDISSAFRGISIVNSSGLDIDSNIVSGNADTGIYASGISNSQIRRNESVSNGMHGIWLYAGSATVSENDASGNLLGDGIFVSPGFSNALIKDNVADDNGGVGIHLKMGVGGITAQSNDGAGNGGFDFQDDNTDCGTNSWINNNGTGSQTCVQ